MIASQWQSFSSSLFPLNLYIRHRWLLQQSNPLPALWRVSVLLFLGVGLCFSYLLTLRRNRRDHLQHSAYLVYVTTFDIRISRGGRAIELAVIC